MSQDHAGSMAVRASNRAYYRQVSEEENLENGVIYFNTDHPTLALCNFVDDVLIEEMGATPDAVLEQVEAAFTRRGSRCCRWIPAAQQAAETLGALLLPRGFVREETTVLTRVPNPVPNIDPRFRMVGARAMRRACTKLLAECFAELGRQAEERLELQLSRMDDPQFDAVVAMVDSEPAGYIVLHQVGEIGRIRDLYVTPRHRRTGVAAASLNYAVATAQRWSLRPICVEIPAGAEGAAGLLDKAGFEQPAQLIRFRASDVPDIVIP